MPEIPDFRSCLQPKAECGKGVRSVGDELFLEKKKREKSPAVEA